MATPTNKLPDLWMERAQVATIVMGTQGEAGRVIGELEARVLGRCAVELTESLAIEQSSDQCIRTMKTGPRRWLAYRGDKEGAKVIGAGETEVAAVRDLFKMEADRS